MVFKKKTQRSKFDEVLNPDIELMPEKTEHEMRGYLAARWKELVYGQDAVIDKITPFVEVFQSGLALEGRPAGVFLLLGPTGTGKTKTVEALAHVLHGSAKHVLRIDCGEFQMEHEVSKLIGAPPGYLGHRETGALLSQAKINAQSSDRCALSIVLFDEIEKGAPSLQRLLLGILDKGSLRTGDNQTVNFERCLIFMTSNVGADRLQSLHEKGLGFPAQEFDSTEVSTKTKAIGIDAVKRKFSPEFVNRIDVTTVYDSLSDEAFERILDAELKTMQLHVNQRLGDEAFTLDVTGRAKAFLLSIGVSKQYGGRELKRVLHREITQPIASIICQGKAPLNSIVRVDYKASKLTFDFHESDASIAVAA